MVLLTVKDVARMIGARRQDVADYANQGLIEFIVLPNRKRKKFTIEAVNAFLERHTVGPKVGPLSETEAEPIVEKAALLEKGQRLPKNAPYQWTERYARK